MLDGYQTERPCCGNCEASHFTEATIHAAREGRRELLGDCESRALRLCPATHRLDKIRPTDGTDCPLWR